MGTTLDLALPEEIPVMTLPGVAFFPQALLPLHIFEPRYRKMLEHVLATDRLFAVAGLDQKRAAQRHGNEPPHRVAGAGIVRACQRNDDGTSSLLLQGLCRVEIVGIVADEPFRRIRIRPLASEAGAPPAENERVRTELSKLVGVKARLSPEPARELAAFLKTVDDPEAFVDIAAFSLCDNPAMKQRLLETLDVNRRLKLFGRALRSDIESLRLRRLLQGKVPDERIGES